MKTETVLEKECQFITKKVVSPSTMEWITKFLLVAQLVFVSSCSVTQSLYCDVGQDKSNKTTINFVLMVPYPDPLNRSSFSFYYDFQGHEMTPIAYMAVKHINNRSDILKDYTLDLIRSDAGCRAGRAVYSFAKDIAHSDKPLAGIVGPTCDSSAYTIAQLTSEGRVPLVSVHWGRLAPLDTTNAFGIIGSVSAIADAYFELIQKNNWKRIAMLYREADYGLQIYLELREKIGTLPGFNITFVSPIYTTFLPLEAIRQSSVRVILVESGAHLQRKLLCLAYHRGMVFPNYQWVTELLYDSDFKETEVFNYNGNMYHCSDREFDTVLNGTVNFFNRFKPDADNVSTFSGLSYEQYLAEFKLEAELYENTSSVRAIYDSMDWANPAYDAVWALALALNSSLAELDDNNLTFTKVSRSNQSKITEIIQRRMSDVDFQGISGRIKFESKPGFVNKTFDLFQYNASGVSERIAFFRSRELTFLQFASPEFIDSKFQQHCKRLDIRITVIFIIIAFAALLLTIPVQVINVAYSSYMSIKASSHQLNHFIFVGCYMIIIGAVSYTLSETLKLNTIIQTVLCNFVPWTASIGLTLILATVCLKTWRLYYIFKKADAMKRSSVVMNDKTLAGIILLLFVVDLLACVTWSVIDPLKPKEVMSLENVGVIVTEIKCESKWTTTWLLVIVSYKGTIMLISLTFALLTRNLILKQFKANHLILKQFKTNNVVILVYLLSIISSMSIPIYLIIRVTKASIAVNFVVVSILLNCAVYICLFVLFLPPVIPIFRAKYHNYRLSDVPQQKREGKLTNSTGLTVLGMTK